jgi:phage gp29-like protein
VPTLYDHLGREVDLDALAKPAAITRPPVKSKTAFELDPERVVSLFKQADDGDPRELQAIAGELERRDAHMGGQLRTRRKAVSRLTWSAQTPADTAKDGGPADEVVTAVTRDIINAPWFSPLTFDLLDANLKGYSVAELRWETLQDVWRPKAAVWVDQRFTMIDKADGLTLRWRDPADENKPIDIAPYTAVIHAAGDVSGPLWSRGLMRVLAILYSIKRLGVRAWAAFVELYGVPRLVAQTPSSWTDKQRADFMYYLDAWGHAGHLVVPSGATVTPQTMGSQSASDAAHSALARWCDDQASVAIIGQTMTSSDGSSRAQAEVHERTGEQILEGDAWQVALTLHRDVVQPYVFLNFGPDAPVPVLVPQIRSTSEREFKLKVMKDLVPLGLQVEQSVARDLAGIPTPAPGAEVLGPDLPPAGLSDAEVEKLARRLKAAPALAAAALPSVARDVVKLAEAIAETDDQDFIDRDGDEAASAWRETMAPLVDAVESAGRAATGATDEERYQDFLARLAAKQADGDTLTRSIAEWAMWARGVGDGTDEVT